MNWKTVNGWHDIMPVNGWYDPLADRKARLWAVAYLRRLVSHLSCEALKIAAERGLAEVEAFADKEWEWMGHRRGDKEVKEFLRCYPEAEQQDCVVEGGVVIGMVDGFNFGLPPTFFQVPPFDSFFQDKILPGSPPGLSPDFEGGAMMANLLGTGVGKVTNYTYNSGRVLLVVENRLFRKETDEELEDLGFEIHNDSCSCVMPLVENEIGEPDVSILRAISMVVPRRTNRIFVPRNRLTKGLSEFLYVYAGRTEVQATEKLFRCIFGPPAAPDDLTPFLSWNGGLVPKLAETISRENAWQDVGVLGDALEEAGCTDPDVLWACRTGPHARGFWVIDVLKGLPHLSYEIKK